MPISQMTSVPGTVRWQLLAEVGAGFEKAWEAVAPGESADFGPHLPPPGNAHRTAILKELIKIDLRIRWQRGQGVELEHYLRLYSELGDRQQLSAEFIYWEYTVRHRHGDKPELQSYQKRFPNQFAELQRLVQSGQSEDRPGFSGVRVPGGKEYFLIERLGSGSFGDVWRAKAPGGVEVAIKSTYRDRSERPAMEMYVEKRLKHRALLGVHAFWDEGDRFYIAMDLADGGSLGKYWKKFQYASPADMPQEKIDELLGYFRDVAGGLDYLHSRGILHRDIKPDNILLDQDRALVADLGLARRQSTGESMAGTLPYMAPECMRGKTEARSDQFSLAAAYAELRLGRRAFVEGDLLKLEPPDLTGLPAEEQQVLRKALAIEPEKRFDTCAGFMQALEKVWRKEPAPVVVAPPPSPPASPWRVWAGRSLPLLFGGLVAFFFYLISGKSPSAPVGVSWLPANTEKADDSQLVPDHQGRWFYDQVVMQVQGKAGPISIPFRLIASRGDRDGEPRTFYIMETKVWNRLFLAAVEAKQFQDLLDEFQEQHAKALRGEWRRWPPADRKPTWDWLPVTDITALEAYCLARSLGGNLPTDDQWMTACGFYLPDRGRGPFREAPNGNPEDFRAIAVHGHPVAVGKSAADGEETRDVGPAPYYCKDMAGNGNEWTRTDRYGKVWTDALSTLKPHSVRQRGQSFYKGEPLKFEAPATRKAPEGPYDFAGDDISFRIVLEQ